MIEFSKTYRGKWHDAMHAAHTFVTGSTLPVTLRQTFYHLVARQLLDNTDTNYKRLSALTAEERRAGKFPSLVDNQREISRAYADKSPKDSLLQTAGTYRLDRAIGQPYQVWMLAEKRGMTAALEQSFLRYGVRIIGLGGYASQTLLDDVSAAVARDGRPAVAIYAGDFDATGQDIPRHLKDRTDSWAHWEQIALTDAQIDEFGLPENPGKSSDSRAAAFTSRNGRLVQVEVDALDPAVLDRLYREAFTKYWDRSAFDALVAREQDEQQQILDFVATFKGGEIA